MGDYNFEIPRGSNDTDIFNFELYDDMGVDTAIVFYTVWSNNFAVNNLFMWGHHSGNGETKSNVQAAEVLNIKQGDISGLEMEMLKGRRASANFDNQSTDYSAHDGLFAVMQEVVSAGTVSIFSTDISVEPEQNMRIFANYDWVENDSGEWDEVCTLILPEDCSNYSFGLYTDTHEKQFYWNGNEFIEEFLSSEIYDFEEIEALQFTYEGYSTDLPVKILDLRYNAKFRHCDIDVGYGSDFASGDFNIYVAVYDKHKKLKEIAVIPRQSIDVASEFEIDVQFNKPLDETDFIKVFACRENLSPLAEL